MEKHLHIIHFTVCYPANYGGVIDLFYKLVALHKHNIKIHLHCFTYAEYTKQEELNKYCQTVHYYNRKKALKLGIPYIVSSRINEELFTNLLKDDYPILMEGVHSSFLLNDARFAERKKIVRLHNVEHKYYKHLAISTNNLFKKLFFLRESFLLKKYEQKIATKATLFYTVTNTDCNFFKTKFSYKNIQYLPLYLPNNWAINSLQGCGKYCLYQADLSIDANNKAAIWLVNKVFFYLQYPVIIAGKNPSTTLKQLAQKCSHIQLIANPTNTQMDELITNAQINILPSNSNAGIKLKLLNALYNGRHCIANNNTVHGSNLESLCYVTDSATQTIQWVHKLFTQPFLALDIDNRKQLLLNLYNNDNNAQQQIKDIWG